MSEQATEKISNGHVNGSEIQEIIEETSFSSKISSSSASSATNDSERFASETNGLKASPVSPSIKVEEDLKILEHLKSFSRKATDEQRQLFLNKIVSESSSSTTTTSSNQGENSSATPSDSSQSSTLTNGQSVTRRVRNEKKLVFQEEQLNNVQESRILRSPVGPPKPPMLSRTRSINKGDLNLNGSKPSTPNTPVTPATPVSPVPPANLASPVTPASPANPVASVAPVTLASPENPVTSVAPGPPATSAIPATSKLPLAPVTPETPSTPPTPLTPLTPSITPRPTSVPFWKPLQNNDASSNLPITSTTVTSTTVPEPLKIETIKIDESCEHLSMKPNSETPASVTATSTPTMDSSVPSKFEDKPISSKHYEHLVEELKCPGCASPMRAPILLCETGHSVCQQCTRILMICPLCKVPFTKQRSLTVEALSSKAHFRCSNAAGGCTVRLQKDLLAWHEKQCIYKPMKCFMGRVWGDCDWDGREIEWKDHIEAEHGNKVFKINNMDLIWNMAAKNKPLSGYYVFQTYEEMFNFYEIHDKDRILFTMTCTSSIRDKKHHYAYEVTIMHPDNEALAITQKFPVHSEYDKDILMEGTCITVSMTDLAKFIDDEKLLHYRVRILQVNSPRKSRMITEKLNIPAQPDFHNTQIVGGNLKNVPSEVIVTRRHYESDLNSLAQSTNAIPSSSEDEFEKIRRDYLRRIEDGEESESDPEFEAFVTKRWGTPQLHFNRKYLKNASSGECSTNEDTISPLRDSDRCDMRGDDDRSSIASTSYKKKVSNTLRKSFRNLKHEISEIKYFGKRSPDKLSPDKLSPN